METFRLILKQVPKLIKGLVLSGFVLPIIGYAVLQFARDRELGFSSQNLWYVFSGAVGLGIIGIFIGTWRVASRSQTQAGTQNDNLKELPHSRVTIGDISEGVLSVGIRARIVLLENSQPDVDSFLNRIDIGDPYCSNCSKPLDIKRASWMADGVQIGYKCVDCQTENDRDYFYVLKSAKREVRSNYDSYWSKYQEEINALSGGHPEKYKLPY